MKKLQKATKLEGEILDWLAIKHPEIIRQIQRSAVVDREYSGTGLFFNLSVPRDVEPFDESVRTIQGPTIKSNQLPNGAASIVFFENGYMKMIEVFGYDEYFPEELEEFELQ